MQLVVGNAAQRSASGSADHLYRQRADVRDAAVGVHSQLTQIDMAQGLIAPRGHTAELGCVNRQQLVQQLREGKYKWSRDAAEADGSWRGARDGRDRQKRARLATRDDAQDELCEPRDTCVAAGNLHIAGGANNCGAVGAEIHGRSSSPGTAIASAPQGIGGTAGGSTVLIRGPPMGLGAQGESAALLERAEGVAKRRPSPMPGEAPMSARERIAAVRRRINDRAVVNAAHVDNLATDKTAGGDDAMRKKTIEVSKMHLSSWRIRESSCASSSKTADLTGKTDFRGAPAGEEDAIDIRAVEVGDARANAAADRAWHGREAQGVAGGVTQPGDRLP